MFAFIFVTSRIAAREETEKASFGARIISSIYKQDENKPSIRVKSLTSCLKNVISVGVYSVASWAISPSMVFT